VIGTLRRTGALVSVALAAVVVVAASGWFTGGGESDAGCYPLALHVQCDPRVHEVIVSYAYNDGVYGPIPAACPTWDKTVADYDGVSPVRLAVTQGTEHNFLLLCTVMKDGHITAHESRRLGGTVTCVS